jgi:hypothetical protein
MGDQVRDSAEWTKSPEATLDYWESLTYEEKLALQWAMNEERKFAQARMDELIAEFKARYAPEVMD